MKNLEKARIIKTNRGKYVVSLADRKVNAILTKADVCDNKEKFVEEIQAMNPGIAVWCVSSFTGEGIEDVREYLKPGVTIALMGSSGVGKSTLINTLAGYEIMKVNGIREKDSKGRHTTTHRELIDLNGTFIVDTPGMREFGLCDVEEGINETFDDIVQLTQSCRFHDCSHKNEPGCAINMAIENGSLSEERWNLYRELMTESLRSKKMSAKKQIAIQRKKLNGKKSR